MLDIPDRHLLTLTMLNVTRCVSVTASPKLRWLWSMVWLWYLVACLVTAAVRSGCTDLNLRSCADSCADSGPALAIEVTDTVSLSIRVPIDN